MGGGSVIKRVWQSQPRPPALGGDAQPGGSARVRAGDGGDGKASSALQFGRLGLSESPAAAAAGPGEGTVCGRGGGRALPPARWRSDFWGGERAAVGSGRVGSGREVLL